MHKDILKEYFSQIAPHISWSTYNYFGSFWDVLELTDLPKLVLLKYSRHANHNNNIIGDLFV